MKKFWGDECARKAGSIRTMLKKGIIMGGGTDAPVVPWNPFIAFAGMVTRRIINGEKLGPDESISREDALYLWKMCSAYTQNFEDRFSSIEPGKLADLAVLSEGILTVPEDRIQSIRAATTIVGGQVVYQAD